MEKHTCSAAIEQRDRSYKQCSRVALDGATECWQHVSPNYAPPTPTAAEQAQASANRWFASARLLLTEAKRARFARPTADVRELVRVARGHNRMGVFSQRGAR